MKNYNNLENVFIIKHQESKIFSVNPMYDEPSYSKKIRENCLHNLIGYTALQQDVHVLIDNDWQKVDNAFDKIVFGKNNQDNVKNYAKVE